MVSTSARMLLVAVAAAVVVAAPAVEGVEKLGDVHFPVSCRPEVQPRFDRAVALLHSFWFRESDAAFADIARGDAACAMAYWGIAMGQRLNPISNVPTVAQLRRGWAAVEQAKARSAPTERERGFIAAVEAFYKDPEQPLGMARFAAYEQAMERLYARFPDDREVIVFYALSLLPNESMLSTDKTYAKQLKAGALLEKIFAAAPEHPGAAHYIIHAYDYPSLARRALPAARRYALIAPSSDHALHMPSHIFTRLGLWQDSIESNRGAALAARAYAAKIDPAAPPPLPVHMLHYMVEAHLNLAQDRRAKAILDEVAAAPRIPDTLGAAIAVAGMPARYALERRRWAEAAALPPRPSRHPYAEAITHFARALGAARTGDLAAARADVARLAALREAAVQGGQEYWAQQIEIQRRAAAGWLAKAEGRIDEAFALVRSAADLEESTQEHQTARDAIVPARHILGELLLDAGRAREALREYEAALAKEPKRFHGLAGAARAADAVGETAKARDYAAQLVALGRDADSERPELTWARALAAR